MSQEVVATGSSAGDDHNAGRSRLKVLLLAQWYRPEPELKIHLLARDLVSRGHSVTVVTGLPNYPTGRIYKGYRLRPWPQIEWMEGVRVIRLPLFPDHSRSALRRLLNYGSFALSASIWGPMLCGPADVMWVYHPPLTVAMPAMIISLLRRIPCVYEIQDMWPETLAATGMVRSSVALGWVGKAAKAVYKWADHICVISEGFRRNLLAKGVPARKISVVPNWADEEIYHPVRAEEAKAQAYGMKGKFNILYAGNMGPAQDLGNLVAAAERVMDLSEVQFVMVGDGVELADLESRVQQRGLTNVRFLGRLAAERVVELAALSEAMLVHLSPDSLFEITIPSKTISSLACGRPVLIVAGGEAAEIVVESGAGVACPPGRPELLERAIRELYGVEPSRRAEMASAALECFNRHYMRRSIISTYEEMFASLATIR